MSKPIESDKELIRINKLKLQRINKADSVDWALVEKGKRLVEEKKQMRLI